MENQNENLEVSRRIKAKRILKGYTQEDVAKMLDVSKTTYISMENKPLELKFKKIKKLASVLECKVEDFLLD